MPRAEEQTPAGGNVDDQRARTGFQVRQELVDHLEGSAQVDVDLAGAIGQVARLVEVQVAHDPQTPAIIGHMGEMLPVMLERCDEAMGADAGSSLQRSVSQPLASNGSCYVGCSSRFNTPQHSNKETLLCSTLSRSI